MSRFRWILLIVLIAFILAFKFLPWYVLVGLAVVFVVGMPLLGKWLLGRVFLAPFQAKGAVLRKADVVVHRLAPAPPPLYPSHEDDESPEEDVPDEALEKTVPLPRVYYRLEVTISPRPKAGGFQHWEPGELRLVAPGTSPLDDADYETCVIERVEIEEDGQFIPDEGYKLAGEQRLRLLIGVRPGTARLVFQYYLEQFGEVVLSGGRELPAPATDGGSR
jgi:hypothetical protein